MTIEDFNKKYKLQGGIKQLSTRRENLDTLKSISEHFEISIERVRQWMIEFFGEKYDPRYERRKRKIETIKNLIEKHGIEKAQVLCPGINRSYLRTAIHNSHWKK